MAQDVIDREVLNRLSELKEAVEEDRVVWPWAQAHKDALVLAAEHVIETVDPGKCKERKNG